MASSARCACGNALKLPIDRVDDAVLKALAADVSRPAVVDAVLEGVLEAMSPSTIATDIQGFRQEMQAADREIGRLTEAIAASGLLASLLDALKTRQARRDELVLAIAARDAVDVGHFNQKTIETKVRRHLNAWRGRLTKHAHDGRQLLREVLSGPLRFTPEGRTYRFEGQARDGKVVGWNCRSYN